MKKIFVLLSLLFIIQSEVCAINFGMYKPEEDYGLIDGIKLNFDRREREEAGKFIQLKQDVPGEKERIDKDKDQKADDEYQMFKFMLDDTIPF